MENLYYRYRSLSLLLQTKPSVLKLSKNCEEQTEMSLFEERKVILVWFGMT